jgi:hypothetical protein
MMVFLLASFSLMLSQSVALPMSQIPYFTDYLRRYDPSSHRIYNSSISADPELLAKISSRENTKYITKYDFKRTPIKITVRNIAVASSVMLGLELALQLLSGKTVQESLRDALPKTSKYIGASLLGLTIKKLPIINRLASSASQAFRMTIVSFIAYTVFDISFRLVSGNSIGEIFADPSFYITTLTGIGLAIATHFLSGPIVGVVTAGITFFSWLLSDIENNRIQKAHEEYALKSIDLNLQFAESILPAAVH